jgi:hypothetical protein
MAYAEKTNVAVSKTKGEIDALLRKHKATGFGTFEEVKRAIIVFEMNGRRIRFDLPIPDPSERRFTHSTRGMRSRDSALNEWEQACRSRWRALYLCVKAKLESIDSKIETFDEAFMPHIVTHDGRKFSEHALPAIERSYLERSLPPLLAGPSS